MQDVKARFKRGNQILFSRSSTCLQELLRLIREQKHRTLVLWAFECVEKPVAVLAERYLGETRPQTAVALCRDWASGKVKMPIAKKALLQVHAMAKELDNPADIALCHAVGQACATVHMETHAIGLPIYELTAIVRERGIESCDAAVKGKIADYIASLNRCTASIDTQALPWADFLLNSRPNKERLLFEQREQGR